MIFSCALVIVAHHCNARTPHRRHETIAMRAPHTGAARPIAMRASHAGAARRHENPAQHSRCRAATRGDAPAPRLERRCPRAARRDRGVDRTQSGRAAPTPAYDAPVGDASEPLPEPKRLHTRVHAPIHANQFRNAGCPPAASPPRARRPRTRSRPHACARCPRAPAAAPS